MSPVIETLAQALDLFVTVGMPARNLADNTRIAYQHDLEEMLTFLTNQNIVRLDRVTLPHLESYQAELERRGLKRATRKRKTP